MSNLHDPENPRHTRLFELLRQKENADQMSCSKGRIRFRKATPEEIETMKNNATRTLMRRN